MENHKNEKYHIIKMITGEEYITKDRYFFDMIKKLNKENVTFYTFKCKDTGKIIAVNKNHILKIS